MFTQPVCRRLAQQTSTGFRLAGGQAWGPTRNSARGQARRWGHSDAYTASSGGSAASSASANGAQTAQSVAFAGQPSGGSVLRKSAMLVLFGLTFSAIGAYGSWHSLKSQGLGFFSDEESLQRFSPADTDAEALRIEETINSHPLVAELRKRTDFVESRPHMKMPGQYRRRSLTGSALSGPGKVPVPAYAWIENGGKSLVSVVFVGEDLCGHPGIVHGGFLATMLDEGLARCCFGALPHNIGVTANLNIDYRKPTPAENYLVLRAETTKVDGRKAWVKGRIESLVAPGETPTVYAEATALFVSPKFAAMLPKIT